MGQSTFHPEFLACFRCVCVPTSHPTLFPNQPTSGASYNSGSSNFLLLFSQEEIRIKLERGRRERKRAIVQIRRQRRRRREEILDSLWKCVWCQCASLASLRYLVPPAMEVCRTFGTAAKHSHGSPPYMFQARTFLLVLLNSWYLLQYQGHMRRSPRRWLRVLSTTTSRTKQKGSRAAAKTPSPRLKLPSGGGGQIFPKGNSAHTAGEQQQPPPDTASSIAAARLWRWELLNGAMAESLKRWPFHGNFLLPKGSLQAILFLPPPLLPAGLAAVVGVTNARRSHLHTSPPPLSTLASGNLQPYKGKQQ